MEIKGFNIRVYGLVVNEQQELLVTDEFRLNQKMTKFPGGGLEFGEGTVDCLHREFMEEMNQPIKEVSHFYTTDFYQKGWFYENMQLISIYYRVKLEEPLRLPISKTPFDFDLKSNNPQSFRWCALDKLIPEQLTFPIDRIVLQMLKMQL